MFGLLSKVRLKIEILNKNSPYVIRKAWTFSGKGVNHLNILHMLNSAAYVRIIRYTTHLETRQRSWLFCSCSLPGFNTTYLAFHLLIIQSSQCHQMLKDDSKGPLFTSVCSCSEGRLIGQSSVSLFSVALCCSCHEISIEWCSGSYWVLHQLSLQWFSALSCLVGFHWWLYLFNRFGGCAWSTCLGGPADL